MSTNLIPLAACNRIYTAPSVMTQNSNDAQGGAKKGGASRIFRVGANFRVVQPKHLDGSRIYVKLNCFGANVVRR